MDQATPGPESVPPQKPKKRLTRKQAKLARERVKNPDATLAGIGAKSGYSSPSKVHRELGKPHVQDRIRELMAANPKTALPGLTKKLASLLEAKETKFFAHEGVVQDERDVNDNGTQARALSIAGDWWGLGEKRVRVTQDPEPPMSLQETLRILAIAQSAGLIVPDASPDS